MFLRYYMVGDIQTNCYIAAADDSKDCIVVDPGDYADYIIEQAKINGYNISAVLLTHGHFDHILGLNDLKAKTDCKVYILDKEKELLETPRLNCSIMHKGPYSATADVLVKDGDTINEAGLTFTVIATPGHTIGSACYYEPNKKILFAGDTLFQMSVGRCDLPTGNERTLRESIKNKLYILPDEVIVYPGHGPETSIGFEKKHNFFV